MAKHTLPIEAIDALRSGTINRSTALSIELYEFMVRVSDKRWVTHFKRHSHDWHSSTLIREDFNVVILDFLLSRKPTYDLTPHGRACNIVSGTSYYSAPLTYWVYCRKVPIIITLLTAKYVGIDYVGCYPMDVAVNIPRTIELHKSVVWLRKRFALDGVDLYSPDVSTNYLPELMEYLGNSKIIHIRMRRETAALDALNILCNRFPEQFGNYDNRGL